MKLAVMILNLSLLGLTGLAQAAGQMREAEQPMRTGDRYESNQQDAIRLQRREQRFDTRRENRGERIENRLQHREERIERRLDRREQHIEKRLDMRREKALLLQEQRARERRLRERRERSNKSVDRQGSFKGDDSKRKMKGFEEQKSEAFDRR